MPNISYDLNIDIDENYRLCSSTITESLGTQKVVHRLAAQGSQSPH